MEGMSVLIRGMEMPKNIGVSVTIYPDGRVIRYLGYGAKEQLGTAVSVPAHGRLIDADALTVKLQRHREYNSDGSMSGAAISNGIGQCLDIINGKECPTIIPAEEVQP